MEDKSFFSGNLQLHREPQRCSGELAPQNCVRNLLNENVKVGKGFILMGKNNFHHIFMFLGETID